MAQNMSDDDFEQKLKELGYTDSALNAASSSQPPIAASASQPSPTVNASMPAADTSDMDKLDQIRLDAANAIKSQPSAVPTPAAPAPASEQMPASEDESEEQPANAPKEPQQAAPYVRPISAAAPAPSPASDNPLESNPELNDEALKNAQQQSRLGTLVANLGNAGSTFSALASGAKPEEHYFDELAKQANVPVEQIMQRRDALMKNMSLAKQMLDYHATKLDADQLQRITDPNSDVSKGARALVLQFEPKLGKIEEFNKMSAKDVKDFADHFIETESKIEATKANREYTQSLKQSQLDTKKDDKTNNDFMKFNKQVQGSIASSRGDFGKNSNVIRQAGQLEQLIKQIKTQPDGADKRQYFELARQLDSMLSSGQGTVSGTKELMPETAKKKYGSLMEFITSSPQGAGLQDFVKRAEDTIHREKDFAIDRNAQTVAKMAPGFQHLKKADPDRWNQILNAQGLQTDDTGNITGIQLPQELSRSASAIPSQPTSAPEAPTPSNALVTIRSKKTGTTKTLDAQTASKYLSDPSFEKVQ